ncbi:MAG: hypothetical protein RL653_2418 [Pseudomonadota bacterium]|jgi:hypothetical protein
MSFLNNVSSALSNPFVRQIAGGVAGLAKGAQGVQAVDKGFKIFDELMSAFGQGPAANPSTDVNQPAVTLQDPRDVLGDLGLDGGAPTQQTAQQTTRRTGSTRSAATASGAQHMTAAEVFDGLKSAGLTALSKDEQAMLNELQKTDPAGAKLQEMQLKMQKQQRLFEAISNILKMMGETQRAIIANMRA